MSSQLQAITHANKFVSGHVLESLGDQSNLFTCAVSKKDQIDVSDDSKEAVTQKNEKQRNFADAVKSTLLQTTLEQFVAYFNGINDHAEASAALSASIDFLLGDRSVNALIVSTDRFEYLKSASLKSTEKLLRKMEEDHNRSMSSGGAVSRADQTKFDDQSKVYKSIISLGGAPLLLPPDYAACYTLAVAQIVDTAKNILEWSSPAPQRKNTP